MCWSFKNGPIWLIFETVASTTSPEENELEINENEGVTAHALELQIWGLIILVELPINVCNYSNSKYEEFVEII